MNYSLFRIMALRRYKEVFAGPTAEPDEIIKKLIASCPSAEFRRGYAWRVGNLQELAGDFLSFCIGRESPTHRAYYDVQAKSFIDFDDPDAPYTHVIVEMMYQVAAIAKNARLSPHTEQVAKFLEATLNEGVALIDARYEIRVKPIPDPETIVKFILNSHRLKSITFEVGRKNNWDASRDVQQPLEKIIDLVKSETAKTTLDGDDLDREVAVGITRAVSAKGRQVKVRAIRRVGEKIQKRTLKKGPIEFDAYPPSSLEDMARLGEYIRGLYSSIRHGK